jgi:hypothetical protein
MAIRRSKKPVILIRLEILRNSPSTPDQALIGERENMTFNVNAEPYLAEQATIKSTPKYQIQAHRVGDVLTESLISEKTLRQA